MKKKTWIWLGVILVAVVIIAAVLLLNREGTAPEATATPEVVESTPEPVETEAPVVTEAPAATEAPEPTQAPTEAPVETEAPAETEAPVQTGTPEETQAPEAAASGDPVIAGAGIDAVEPEATQEPTAEPTQEPTAEPTQEPTAEPTQEPTAEPEPGETRPAGILRPGATDVPEPTEAPVATEEPAATTAPAFVPAFEPGPKLGDVRVRQALLYALDRENFILADYGSAELATVGLAPISPTSWAFPDENELNPYAFDLDKANALLDEAGWEMADDGFRYKDGEKLALSWLVYHEATWPATISGMAADTWKQIGVDLTIELMDFNTVSDRAMEPEPGEKDFDIYTMGFSLDIDPDPSGGLFDYDAFVAGGFNASGYYNERAQELIALGKQEFDQEKRTEIYQEWAKIMNEEVPTTIIAFRSEIWGVGNNLQGFENIGTYANWSEAIEKLSLTAGDTLRFAENSFNGKFNSIMYDDVYDSYISTLVSEGLVRPQADGTFAGRVADYELSEDNLTYTFTLKDGVAFSDGTPMTTEDVKFTYMMIAHPEYTGPRLNAVSGFAGYKAYAAGEADDISGIEIIDERTIAFTFENASPANIQEFVYGIQPKAYYEKDTMEAYLALNNAPMGSGQYILTGYAPGEYVQLEINPNYWNEELKPQIERIYITVVPDESKLAALQLGELDFTQLQAKVEHVEAVEADDNLWLHSYLGNGYTFMAFNTLH